MPRRHCCPGSFPPERVTKRLKKSFYARDALEVARGLVGCVLWHNHPDGRTAVRLVETEAYLGERDPGSHGFRGKTPRTRVMFGAPARLYVYFTYGMHWCVNVVCGREGECAAVLLRAGEPVAGLDLIRSRRPAIRSERLLAAGPGRLAQAMGIEREHNGASLLRGSSFWCTEDEVTDELRAGPIATTPRIGLGAGKGDELPWRYVIPGHPHASRRT